MQISPLTQLLNFILRYKLPHIAFWLYHFITFFHVLEERFGKHPMNFVEATIIIGIQAVLVYSVLFILIPRTIEKRKYVRFVMGILYYVALSVIITILLQDLTTLLYLNRHIRSYNLLPKFISGYIDSFLLVALFIGVYSIKDKYYAERNKALQEKEKLKAELDFLKNQLNPHFLFNAINSIYVLIRQDRQLAERTLLEFSGLLRYQLYDCANEKTLLEKEMKFISDYVQLEKIRSDQTLNIELELPNVSNQLKIAPFVLITFVENAFKHKSSDPKNCFIRIKASLNGDRLLLNIENSFSKTNSEIQTGGIGLRNVRRRLDLLYPNKHILKIEANDNVFSVNLEINLTES